ATLYAMQKPEILNEKQKEAVLHTEGPLLIVAGAGAGKTKTITERILHLIKKGVPPHEILAVTFTNKAAGSMKERVEKLLSNDRSINNPVSNFERPFISTFHSLGVHIIKEQSAHLGRPRHFTIFDRSDSLSSIRKAVKEIGLDPKQFEPNKFLSIISRQKGEGTTLADYETKATDNYLDRILLLIWQKYEKSLSEEKAYDFDDLLLISKNLLEQHKDIRELYQNRWRYIHIDEYQDTNRVQYEMAKLLAEKNKNICVVGDIDQSIYSWRGADFKNLMRFEKDYPETKIVLLEENYRSTKTILEAANSVIEKNVLRPKKNLFTQNVVGEKISLFGAYDEAGEAAYIAQKTQMLIQQGVNPSEIALLYRANFQSRILEEIFLTENIPYQVLGVRFFERREVKDTLSYLRAAMNTEGVVDLKRIINTPARGLGKITILKLFGGQEKELPEKTRKKISDFKNILARIKEKADALKLSETILFVIKESGLEKYFKEMGDDGEERLLNVFELVSVAQKYDFLPPEEAVEKFLTDAALASDQDDLKEEKNGVRLMTVHAAKGLEFDYVFICGLEEDLFPHKHPEGGKKNDEEKEEERRLFYVALTRARKKLFLCYASVRTIFGNRQLNIPSSFLDDISPEILESEFSDDETSHGKILYLE
ncbi:MAG: UvrD-helicase domain-containing protein, partial [bacterium]|nr:UvrD-helicase domain-containing protein [bacterium]